VILDAIADGDETAIRNVLAQHMREAATWIAQAQDGEATAER